MASVEEQRDGGAEQRDGQQDRQNNCCVAKQRGLNVEQVGMVQGKRLVTGIVCPDDKLLLGRLDKRVCELH